MAKLPIFFQKQRQNHHILLWLSGVFPRFQVIAFGYSLPWSKGQLLSPPQRLLQWRGAKNRGSAGDDEKGEKVPFPVSPVRFSFLFSPGFAHLLVTSPPSSPVRKNKRGLCGGERVNYVCCDWLLLDLRLSVRNFLQSTRSFLTNGRIVCVTIQSDLRVGG